MTRALVVALLLVGCKKNTTSDVEAFRERARGFRDRMCACNTVECGDKVLEEIGAHVPPEKVTSTHADAETRQLLIQTGKCHEKLATPAAPAEPDAGVPEGPAIPAKADDADALLRAARDYQYAKYPEVAIRSIHVYYVDANGALDPEHGALSVIHGAPAKPLDDPRRKTGAPVPENPLRPANCRAFYWQMSTRAWGVQDSGCPEVPAIVPKCNPSDIWKRALDKGAPADALAKLEYHAYYTPPRWSFDITDKPRNVHVRHRFDDDCAVAVEKP